MTGQHTHTTPDDGHIESELARALRLSASLNNPTDHAIVASYIAELEGRAMRTPNEPIQLS